MRVIARFTNSINPALNGKPQSVEYTNAEMDASEMFDRLLDQNYGVTRAATDALLAMPQGERSAAFAEWLSDETVTVDETGLVVRPR